jgi:cation:H+ antiporter
VHPVLTFLLCGAVVAAAGSVLARYGDVIADRTGLGKAFVGALLVAGATSLPELATDISATRIGLPDVAVGDLFGSGMANMLILGLADLWPGARTLRRVAVGHATLAAIAIGLTAAAALFVMAPLRLSVLGVGVDVTAVAVAYLLGVWSIRRHGVEMEPAVAGVTPEGGPSLRRAVLGFSGAALAILLAAPAFARSAGKIAELTGLGTTFVGAVLVGFSTSLPELASTIAAVRARSYDLAVGNLFGSNAINMSFLFFADAADGTGPLLVRVSPTHGATALLTVVMMAVGLAGVVSPRREGWNPLVPAGVLLVALYGAGVALLALAAH